MDAHPRQATAVPFQFGVDFVNGPVPSTPDFKAEGGMVFAGYGIVYPEGKRDDYKGLDVKGKIVAILPGTPEGPAQCEVNAHFGDDDQKARLAEARGAKAVIILESPSGAPNMPFEAIVPFYDYQRNTWAGPDGVAHIARARRAGGRLCQPGRRRQIVRRRQGQMGRRAGRREERRHGCPPAPSARSPPRARRASAPSRATTSSA
jgi:hypothetical protein